jgi:hypothetical protein
MRRDKPTSGRLDKDEPAAHRVRLPGFSAEKAVGLGDVMKRTTSLVGIRPCGSCLERAASLNRWVVFTGRR